MDFRTVGVGSDHALSQLALSGARFGRQDVTRERVMALDLTGSGLLEPFRRAFVSL